MGSVLMKTKKLFLIDAHAMCYRAFYAIKELRTSRGQATNAVYGFVVSLRKILSEFNPDYMVVCFDSPEKTFRAEKFAEYKIQRPSMPDDLISQIPIIKDVVRALNLEIVEKPGYEADDIIATLTDRFVKDGIDVVIVTEDKDMFQLVDEKVKFYSARKSAILDYEDVKKKLGFEPKKIVDFIALAGDKADNIPGVVGIGDVNARNLINQFGDLDQIIKSLKANKTLKSKEQLIVDQEDSAYLSRDLALLELKVPMTISVDNMKVEEPDRELLFGMFKELEFRRLANEFAPQEAISDGMALVEIKDKEGLDPLLDRIKKADQLAYLTQWSDSKDKSLRTSAAHYFFDGLEPVYVVDATLQSSLKTCLSNFKGTLCCYNLKSLYKTFSLNTETCSFKAFDILLAAYLLGQSPSQLNISEISWKYFHKSTLSDNLCHADVQDMINLLPVLKKELEDKSLTSLYQDIELPLSAVLYAMEEEGITLDVPLLEKMSAECQKKIDGLTVQLYEKAGEEFNLNSPKQLSRILFEKLGLPVIKKTKTGFSTNEEVLTKLALNHDVPSLILEYRQLAKLQSTYLDALPKLLSPQTHRIHTEFNQIGAETGRLSSSHPNLQNIPIKTELGRKIRGAFTSSSKDHILIAADYSQIELRVLADLSKDETLINAFKKDQDIHSYTSALIFDIPEEDVTKEMRYSAKRVNFGIIYGMSAFGLAKDLDISQPEAQGFIDRYFLRYPGVKQFMDDEIAKCERDGYVTTLLKRRRYIPEINSKNMGLRQFAQRQAINTPVQGTAADLIKLAMINMQNAIKKATLKSKMILTVHDELVFDVVVSEQEKMAALIKEIMENPLTLSVPIKVSMKMGQNWLEMKDLT